MSIKFTAIDASLAAVISGTIVAAAIINEIIAVILAKVAFQKAGEIRPVTDEKSGAVQAEEYRER